MGGEDYEVIEQMRRGPFGKTYLVLHKAEKRKYVLKRIPLKKQTDRFKRTARQEMALIARLSNPYIVEYKDSWVEKDCLCIVTSYCEGGDMGETIKRARGALFSEEYCRLCEFVSSQKSTNSCEPLEDPRFYHRCQQYCRRSSLSVNII